MRSGALSFEGFPFDRPDFYESDFLVPFIDYHRNLVGKFAIPNPYYDWVFPSLAGFQRVF